MKKLILGALAALAVAFPAFAQNPSYIASDPAAHASVVIHDQPCTDMKEVAKITEFMGEVPSKDQVKAGQLTLKGKQYNVCWTLAMHPQYGPIVIFTGPKGDYQIGTAPARMFHKLPDA